MISFRDLAEVFQELERTSSSSSLIAILAAFLSRLDPEEAKAVAYLLRGEVAPPFASREFGMAERMVIGAVAQAYATPLQQVDKLAARLGDIGTVAEKLARNNRKPLVAIASVFAQLREITDISGKGSQELKRRSLAQLLAKVSGIEAKYILRTILGTYRIGVGEMIFLRALTKAFASGAADQKSVEDAYNVLSDLGEVARRMARSGVAGVKRIAPVPGTPVRMMLASRVQALDGVMEHMRGKMFVEYKYDGERVQIHRDRKGNIQLFSRRLARIGHQYPEIVDAIKKGKLSRQTIIEGEIVAFDTEAKRLLPFQTLMQRRRRHDVEAYVKKVPTALFLFDILLCKGRNLLGAPLTERRKVLQACIKASRIVHLSQYTMSSDLAGIERYFHRAIADGAEGVVIKLADGCYQAGKRGWLWIKFKKEYQKQLADTFDLVIVGALYGKGARAGGYGSLLLASFDPDTNKYYTLTKVGAGFSDQLLRKLPKLLKPYRIGGKHRLVETGMRADVWFEPMKVVEVSGAELTVSPVHTAARHLLRRGGLALRFPRLIRFREDKAAEQATTVREIYDMYQSTVRKRAA